MQGTKEKTRSTRKIITNSATNAARLDERRPKKGCLESRGGLAGEGVGERGPAVGADQNPLKGSSLMLYSSSPAVLLPL